MSESIEMVSFELKDKNLLDDWKALSKEIDEDIAKADGFISRDSGMDEAGRVYCLVKWQTKAHQEKFMQQLTAREEWPKMMEYFGSIADMETMKPHHLALF